MTYEIVLGRSERERQKFGLQATVPLGKHYVKMGQVTALAQPVYLDLNKAHVVFVCGKRGSGKSYSLGVIAEGIAQQPADIKDKMSVILLDTMGIYWTMKYPNHQDEAILKEYGTEGKGFRDDIKIYTPFGFFKEYKDAGIPTDVPFAIRPAELSPEEWNLSFDLAATDPVAVFIERVILEIKKQKGDDFDIKDIRKAIESDGAEDIHIKQAADNRFRSADAWGLFSRDAMPIKDLARGGQITVLDLSPYIMMPNGWRIKHLALGIVCQKIFVERVAARKMEEYQSIQQAVHYILSEEGPKASELPIVWLMVDEAHEFIPRDEVTASSPALITLLREGRQPGVAMVLATQQPGKIHTDAMTQSDVILAHRLTAKIDTDALGILLQSYQRDKLDAVLDNLPRVPGAALAMDDVNERIYPMQVQPRQSWHGGSAPTIIEQRKNALVFGGGQR